MSSGMSTGITAGAMSGASSGTVPVSTSGTTSGTVASGGTVACNNPTFAPAAGTVVAGTAVTITAAGLPANGFIYYTTDQTMPTHASMFVASGGTVTVSQTETITAIAYAMGACSDSAVATATYEVAVTCEGCGAPPACAAPTFMPAAGAVVLGTTVTIVPPANFPANFPQGSGTIYYTVDGTIPTHASPAYSGPIQINATETIHAIASDPAVCTDSTIALATFTVVAPCACCDPLQGCIAFLPVAFNPPTTTQANDFLVQLTDSDPAATICFTFGANNPPPACTVTAASATCSGTSPTYNPVAGLGATGSVTINGGVTTAAGTVVVNAMSCAPGNAAAGVVSQTYTLQAAAPTMQGPAPSPTLLYQAGGYMPTLSSVTAGSTLNYTADGSTPTCATGTLLAMNPGAVPNFTTNSTFNAIACKTGYAPSTVGGPFAYNVVLPTPTFVDSASTTTVEGTGTYDAAPTIQFDDGIADGVTGLFYCSTTDSSAPVCGAAGACTHGTAGTTLAITTTGTVVNVVACAPNENTSAGGTATYTLQLDAATDATTE
jgi:chitobiase/beta-hexosaminidase-like protein